MIEPKGLRNAKRPGSRGELAFNGIIQGESAKHGFSGGQVNVAELEGYLKRVAPVSEGGGGEEGRQPKAATGTMGASHLALAQGRTQMVAAVRASTGGSAAATGTRV